VQAIVCLGSTIFLESSFQQGIFIFKIIPKLEMVLLKRWLDIFHQSKLVMFTLLHSLRIIIHNPLLRTVLV